MDVNAQVGCLAKERAPGTIRLNRLLAATLIIGLSEKKITKELQRFSISFSFKQH